MYNSSRHLPLSVLSLESVVLHWLEEATDWLVWVMLVESFGHYDVTLLTLRGRGTSCCWLNTQGVTGFKFFFLCINDLDVSTFKICWGKRLDLISLILLLKRSAKSSQRVSVGVFEDLLKLRITFKVVVKKDFQPQSWKECRFQTYTSININMPMDFLWSINIKETPHPHS